MSSILIKSYAKINLTLKILGKRADGFHNIESIMQNVSLFDLITLSDEGEDIKIEILNPKSEILNKSKIQNPKFKIPEDSMNTCWKAVEEIWKKSGIKKGVRISIEKNIPTEAGLGGGSSNAAAVLIGLNKMWELKLTDDELVEIAAQIGSDVPFFIVGGRCLCRGRGEKIEKFPISNFQCPMSKSEQYIIVKPDVSVPTKWAYQEWDKKTSNLSLVASKTDTSDESLATSPFENDLEPIVIAKYPVIGQIKQDLVAAGCSRAQMTGSGSAVFGIVEDKKGEGILKKIKKKYQNSFLVKETDRGTQILR